MASERKRELRRRRHRREERRKQREEFEERRRLLPPGTPLRMKTVRIQDQYAVLVGGYFGSVDGLPIHSLAAVSLPELVPTTPRSLALAQSAPNPFGAGTTISFGLARAGEVSLDIFDTQGRLVRRLKHGALAAGNHIAAWDGADDSGAGVPPGVYSCRLVTPARSFERRIVRVR